MTTESKQATVKVSLVIKGFSCAPEEVTEIIGVDPTRTWLRGDRISALATNLRHENGWELKGSLGDGNPLDVQVLAMLRLLAPAQSRFSGLPDCSVRLSCAVYAYEGSPQMFLPREAIAGLAGIGAEVDIDYYDMTE
jgi:Domain of unknown function (DUF4279)